MNSADFDGQDKFSLIEDNFRTLLEEQSSNTLYQQGIDLIDSIDRHSNESLKIDELKAIINELGLRMDSPALKKSLGQILKNLSALK